MPEKEKAAAESLDDLLRRYAELTQGSERLRGILDFLPGTPEYPFSRTPSWLEIEMARARLGAEIVASASRRWGTREWGRGPFELARGWFQAHAAANPLLAAGLAIEEEAGIDRTKEIVVQGTLAYIGGADIDYPVDRYLPVDIHLPDWEPEKVADISVALRALSESIGCQYIEYPALAKSSAHARGVIRTPKKTQEEFERFHVSLAILCDRLEQREVVEKLLSGEAADTDLVKLHAELLNLNAETKKTDAERRKVEREIKHANVEAAKTAAEIKKIEEETKKTRAEKFNIFATAFMKIALAVSMGASIIMGGVKLSSESSTNKPSEGNATVIVVKAASKGEHASKLQEFLKTLGEMEEAATKATGE